MVNPTKPLAEIGGQARKTVEDQLFTHARSFGSWREEPVNASLLRQLVSLAQWGPTSMNSQPARYQFAISRESRERLSRCVDQGNVSKVLAAPVVAIIGMDMNFSKTLAQLFPQKSDAHLYYDKDPEKTHTTALRNSSLQGAYLIMAARLMGLDCGPMSGFNQQSVDQEFWAGTSVRTNFLCCIGHGDRAGLKPRGPRMTFDEISRVI
jgi:3-hydroxypropanoate dehydrogenase